VVVENLVFTDASSVSDLSISLNKSNPRVPKTRPDPRTLVRLPGQRFLFSYAVIASGSAFIWHGYYFSDGFFA
jgi:hypothetical protein